MSDLLPACPSVFRLSLDQCRNAAIYVCQHADYERDTAEQYLLALGLIKEADGGFVPDVDVEGRDWFAHAARRAKA